jgi:hypothetical protein
MGIFPHQLLGRLDRAGFCSIQVWDFSFRSLPREYARLFFLKAVVAHPARTARALLRYRRFVRARRGRAADYARSTMIPDDTTFLQSAHKAASPLLLGLGFCLKPTETGSASGSCPSGRANHECLFLERCETTAACADCAILEISRRALEKGCPVYIMTSARDIARDFMFAQVARGSFPASILLLCPYSIQAIIPPLLICGVDSFLVPYSSGACADYEQWLKADVGIKAERTTLSPGDRRKIWTLLDELRDRQPPPRRFRRRGHVFFPD